MSSSLIRSKYLIGRVIDNDRAEVIEDGAIFQRDGKIVEIGAWEDLSARHQPDEVLGNGTHIVVPGFVNGHHHVGVTPFQLGCPDLPLELWIPWRLAARSVDPYLDTLYSAFEMIESGVTTVQHLNTHCFGSVEPCAKNAEAILRAYRDIGMRVSFSFLIHDQNHLVYEADNEFVKRLPDDLGHRMNEFFAALHITAEDQLQLFEDMHARYNGDPFTRIQLAPANLHWNSDPLLAKFAEYSERFDVPMHMHLAETTHQKEYARRRTGSTAVQHLHKFDLLGEKMTLGHGVWLTDRDMDLLAETGTNVCHCPSSNLRLRSGIAPVNELAERGIRIAIGIDEAGINDDRDMLQEMRLALNLHRKPGMDDAVPTPCQLLRMATENSAMTTPFGTEIGVLEPGRAADLTLIRWEQIAAPYLEPEVPVVSAMLHRAKTSGVDTVIVGGEPVYRNGRFTRVDKEAVLEELTASLSRPCTPIEEKRRQIGQDVYGHVEAFYRGHTSISLGS